jgi:hypothetical protein
MQAGAHARIADKPPLVDYQTPTAVIRWGSSNYLIRTRSDTGATIEVVGRHVRGASRKDTLRPDKDKGEFVHRHESGNHYYLLEKVDETDAKKIIEERNAPR